MSPLKKADSTPVLMGMRMEMIRMVSFFWQFYMVGPPAAYLQLPYLVWCLYSAYLNFCMFRLN